MHTVKLVQWREFLECLNARVDLLNLHFAISNFFFSVLFSFFLHLQCVNQLGQVLTVEKMPIQKMQPLIHNVFTPLRVVMVHVNEPVIRIGLWAIVVNHKSVKGMEHEKIKIGKLWGKISWFLIELCLNKHWWPNFPPPPTLLLCVMHMLLKQTILNDKYLFLCFYQTGGISIRPFPLGNHGLCPVFYLSAFDNVFAAVNKTETCRQPINERDAINITPNQIIRMGYFHNATNLNEVNLYAITSRDPPFN